MKAGKTTKTPRGSASSAGPNVLGPARVHDADLCDRIRLLELEVERLKADRHHCHGWYPYSVTTWPNFTYTNTLTTSSSKNA